MILKATLALLVMLGCHSAFAARPVLHQHHCPSLLDEQGLCFNYEEFPPDVALGEPTSFVLAFYDVKSARAPERRYQDLVGTFDLTLDMEGRSQGGTPLKVTKLGTGRYLVENAVFKKPGLWWITLMIKQPGHELYNKNDLYVYLYKEGQ